MPFRNPWPLGQAPDLVLQIGVSFYPDLDFYRGLEPRRICIVEPDPEVSAELNKQAQAMEGIDIMRELPGAKSGDFELHQYNFPRFNSCFPLSSDISGFPGLRKTGSIRVRQKEIGEWIEELGIEGSDVNWLFYNHPGSESEFFKLLEEVGALECFSRIFLSAGKRAFHEGAKAIEDILEELGALGFQQEGFYNDVDPEWPRVHLVRNNEALRSKQLSLQLEDLVNQKADLEQLLQESVDWLNSVQIELMTNQGDARSRIEKLEMDKKNLADKLDQTDQELRDTQTKNADLVEQLKTKSDQLAHFESLLTENDQRIGDFLEREEKLQDDLSVSLRLQALRDADLKDLQGKYAKYRDLSRRQADLLSNLRQRLISASEILKLANEGDEAIAYNDLADTLVRALEGDKG